MSHPVLPDRWLGPSMPDEEHRFVERDRFEGDERGAAMRSVLEGIALLRRHWLVVVLFAAAGVGISYYRVRQERPIYRATAVVRLVDKARAVTGGLGGNSGQPNTWLQDPMLSQIQVLQSRAVAAAVVEREGLRLEPLTRDLPAGTIQDVRVDSTAPDGLITLNFTDAGVVARSEGAEAHAAYGSPLTIRGVQLTVPKRPGTERADLAVQNLEVAVAELRNELRGRPRDRTNIVEVTYSSTDPALAQRVVNSAVEVFQTLNASTAKQESLRRRRFVEGQLAKTKASFAEAQLAVNSFRTRQKVFSSRDKARTQQTDLGTLEIRRQELNADRQTYQALLDALQQPKAGATGERMDALLSSPGVASNPVVQRLYGQRSQYQAARDSLTGGQWGRSPNNPDVRKLDTLITTTETKIVAAVRGQLEGIDVRLKALDDLKANAASELASIPGAEAEESRLVAQTETYRKQADRLEEELQTAQIQEAAEAGEVEILDLATLPGLPISAGRVPKLILALLLGLGLGAGVAYFLEHRTTVIRRQDELEALRVPNLALVPRIDSRKNGVAKRLPRTTGNGSQTAPVPFTGDELVTFADMHSRGAEAYRTLRTNLLFSAAVQAVKRLVVTSAGPKEGKSITSANLSVAFAQQGHRVLLIDADLRRPRIHKMFNLPSEPGLTDVLVHEQVLAQAIRPTGVERLFLLTAGRIAPNPAELVGSTQMREVLDTLSETYDIIIIDTPPVLAASDAAILGRMCDGALVVVRAGGTERAAAHAAVQQLATIGTRILGTVLNDPDAEIAKYASYYHQYYNNYYDYSHSEA